MIANALERTSPNELAIDRNRFLVVDDRCDGQFHMRVPVQRITLHRSQIVCFENRDSASTRDIMPTTKNFYSRTLINALFRTVLAAGNWQNRGSPKIRLAGIVGENFGLRVDATAGRGPCMVGAAGRVV